MISMEFSMQLTVAVLSGFVFCVACHDNRRQCLEVESKTICYFTPNVSSVNWDTAWKTCRDLDSTLPVILNEKGQEVLRKYLGDHFSGKPVWTAGRYVGGDSEWKWSNGRNFHGTNNPSCPYNASVCPYETHAVLTKDLRYEARYPINPYAFICSYPGINCRTESQKSIGLLWKGGCLNWTTNHRLRPNKARNECLKNGGDLATFSEDANLQGLPELFSAIKDDYANEYWIGLHRKWWIWNTTDAQDIIYNLLDEYEDQAQKDCLYINEYSKWSRDKCSFIKNVICETATERTSPDATFAASVAIGIAIAILAVAIIVVILLIFIRRRLRVAESKRNITTSDQVTPSQKAIVQGTDDTYATIDDDDLENLNHKNSQNPYKDRLGNLSIPESKPGASKSDPTTPSHKVIVQSTDDTYATIDVDDDVENLNYQNGPNPSTAYTNVELCNDPSAEYSELNDFGASATERSTNVYADPYINSSVTAVSKTPAIGSPSDIYSEVNKPRLGKKSDELTSPPIKIGPHGDIYTLPISPK